MLVSDWMQRIDLTEEIQEVYIHSFLFKLATSLVSIFIPFYVLELGFSATYVFSFFILYYLAHIVFAVPLSSVASKIGYKHLSLLSSIPILIFYLFMRSVKTSPELHIAALIGGFGFTTYWTGMNSEVAQSTHSEKEDKESGFFISMPSLASMISPFVGGVILAVFNFSFLFVLTAVLIAFSFMPFLFSGEHRDGMEIDFSQLLSQDYLDDFLMYFFEGGESVSHKLMWPLYITVVIGGSLNIGGVGSLLALGSAASSIFVGKISDKAGRNSVLLYGSTMLAAVIFTMAYTGSPVTAFIVSLLHGIFYTSLSVPLYSSAIDRSEEIDLLEYFAFREMSLSAGRITVIGIGAASFLYVPDYRFIISFSAIAASVLVCSFFARKMNGEK